MRIPRLEKYHAGLIGLCAFQIFFTLSAFASLKDILGPGPILNVDWCSQYYWSHAARSFYHISGRIWGYDPYYMAGYPLDFVFNSSLPVQITSLALNSLSIGVAIKIFYLASFTLVPIFLYLSLKNFGLNPVSATATAALGTVYFWLAEDALFGQWGMLSGSFILNFFLFPLSLLYRWLKHGSKQAFISLFLALPIAVLIHKTALILILISSLLLLVAFRHKLNTRFVIALTALVIWTLLVNAFWLIPLIHFFPLKIEDPSTTFFQNTDPFRFIKDLVPFQAYYAIPLCRLFLVGSALSGAISLWRNKENRPEFRFFVMVISAFFLLTYFGSFAPALRHIQPYRYVTALYFLILPLSGLGLARAYQGRRASAALAFIAVLAALMIMPSWRYFPSVSPLSTSLPQEVSELLHWLEQNTDRKARIMIEDNNVWEGASLPYGPTRFPGILPALLPRECVGGPLPNAFIKHHHVGFHDGRFLDREIEKSSEDWLIDRVRLYNIKWAVCWSDASKSKLRGIADLVSERANFNDIAVFEFAHEPDFFLKGRGTAEADYDRIRLSDLCPEEGEIIIKYHYDEGFKAEPEVELFRADVPDDPIGFIGIRHPGKELTLYYLP
jgi:hypothetical protein